MERLVELLTSPDNLVVMGMFLVAIWLTLVAFSEARKNDRLSREGHPEEIAKRMRE